MYTLDFSKMHVEIEDLLAQYHCSYTFQSSHDSTKTYDLNDKTFSYQIIIGPKWVGFELSLNKQYKGRIICLEENTDLYPITEKYYHFTLEVYKSVINNLNAFCERKIITGESNGRAYIAVPLGGDKYQVKWFKVRSKWWQFDTSVTEIVSRESVLKLI